MIYRAVGNRCAVDLNDLQLPISLDQALSILEQIGCKRIEIVLISLARSVLGATYRRAARLKEAPQVFDCSSLVKWLYGQKGIWIPRRSIQQREMGTPVNPCDIRDGDIVFVSGHIDYYYSDPTDGVGHVGIATRDGTVVHAANRKVGVIESPYEEFTSKGLRGIRRFIPETREVYTFETPPEREVEWSDDFRWIILQNLPKG